MKTLMVVEDEKLIRQGIVAMAKKSGVEIGEIIECRNGEEALKILQIRPIDVMFSDIRMPKMDGIKLVNEIQKLPKKPKVVIISGYDDFNYAVEMMRNGVREYLLKPLERDKVAQILLSIDEELKKEADAEEEQLLIQYQQMKYLFTSSDISEEDMSAIEHQFERHFQDIPYVVLLCSPKKEIETLQYQYICLDKIKEHHLFIIAESQADDFIRDCLAEYCVGKSLPHQGARQCRQAYNEAEKARMEAFVKGTMVISFRKKEKETEEIPREFASQFVQQFGTDKMEQGLRQLHNLFFQAKRGNISSTEAIALLNEILTLFSDTYTSLIEMDLEGYQKCASPLTYRDAEEYLTVFQEWLMQMKQLLLLEFDDHKSKEKIHMALQYIHENYQKDLNMAMVSNYISMNYSLFSITFKEYTGVNFVNYLKTLRIKEAKRLLAETDDKIIDISRAVGYDNDKHFMKTFKNICGVSPSEYRKNALLKE